MGIPEGLLLHISEHLHLAQQQFEHLQSPSVLAQPASATAPQEHIVMNYVTLVV